MLLAAYAHWGEAALDRLVGMFAFVLWDQQEQVAFAARDHFGIKPLYFFVTPAGVAFASEIKQFLGLPGFAARLNVARAYDFLSSGIMEHTDETLFEGVRQLRGGECVRARSAALACRRGAAGASLVPHPGAGDACRRRARGGRSIPVAAG